MKRLGKIFAGFFLLLLGAGCSIIDYSSQGSWISCESGVNGLEADIFLLPGDDAAVAAYPQISGIQARFFIPRLSGDRAKSIADAFAYYSEHYNNGRPFILAGSGKDAGSLKELLKNALSDEVLCRRLVAAYLINTPDKRIDMTAYPNLRLSVSGFDTGVIVFADVKNEKDLHALSADMNTRIGTFWK